MAKTDAKTDEIIILQCESRSKGCQQTCETNKAEIDAAKGVPVGFLLPQCRWWIFSRTDYKHAICPECQSKLKRPVGTKPAKGKTGKILAGKKAPGARGKGKPGGGGG